MRMLPEVEHSLTNAISRIANKHPNMKSVQAQEIILELCRKSYRLGVAEFQEPIHLELDEEPKGPSESEL